MAYITCNYHGPPVYPSPATRYTEKYTSSFREDVTKTCTDQDHPDKTTREKVCFNSGSTNDRITQAVWYCQGCRICESGKTVGDTTYYGGCGCDDVEPVVDEETFSASSSKVGYWLGPPNSTYGEFELTVNWWEHSLEKYTRQRTRLNCAPDGKTYCETYESTENKFKRTGPAFLKVQVLSNAFGVSACGIYRDRYVTLNQGETVWSVAPFTGPPRHLQDCGTAIIGPSQFVEVNQNVYSPRQKVTFDFTEVISWTDHHFTGFQYNVYTPNSNGSYDFESSTYDSPESTRYGQEGGYVDTTFFTNLNSVLKKDTIFLYTQFTESDEVYSHIFGLSTVEKKTTVMSTSSSTYRYEGYLYGSNVVDLVAKPPLFDYETSSPLYIYKGKASGIMGFGIDSNVKTSSVVYCYIDIEASSTRSVPESDTLTSPFRPMCDKTRVLETYSLAPNVVQRNKKEYDLETRYSSYTSYDNGAFRISGGASVYLTDCNATFGEQEGTTRWSGTKVFDTKTTILGIYTYLGDEEEILKNTVTYILSLKYPIRGDKIHKIDGYEKKMQNEYLYDRGPDTAGSLNKIGFVSTRFLGGADIPAKKTLYLDKGAYTLHYRSDNIPMNQIITSVGDFKSYEVDKGINVKAEVADNYFALLKRIDSFYVPCSDLDRGYFQHRDLYNQKPIVTNIYDEACYIVNEFPTCSTF